MDLKTLVSLANVWRKRASVCDDEAKRLMDGTPSRIANERYRDAYLQCAHDLEIVIGGGKPFDHHPGLVQTPTVDSQTSEASAGSVFRDPQTDA